MIKLLIADDHTLVREGLKQILNDISEVEVSGEARNGQEVIDKVSTNHYDLILLDISFPGKSGLDVLKRLRALKPELPVIILSMHPEDQYAIRSLKAGASGYLTKESSPQELIGAILKVANGRKYISPSIVEKLAFALETNAGIPAHEKLSDREYQVMCLIASGKRVKEIADSLSLSVKTISTHRARILKKMSMKTNAQLTYYAIKNALVE